MGLTGQSTGFALLKRKYTHLNIKDENQIVVALAGNPNTGKSTLFNYLTGLNQHTGNWPGKTVTNAQGYFKYKDNSYLLVDLPGTYSLLASSVEEEVARDFICFGNPSVTIVVTDATCLERNLNLVLQVMEITDKVIICLNLVDEAKRKGIHINVQQLQKELGVPVVATVAREGKGVDQLLKVLKSLVTGEITHQPLRLTYADDIERTVKEIEVVLQKAIGEGYNTRWLALRLIDGDQAILTSIKQLVADDFEMKAGD